MLLFADLPNFDDVFSLIILLKSGIKIDAIIITGNGWNEASPGLTITTYITKWFGRDIPIIAGSLYSLKDYKENYEEKGYPQGLMFGRTIPRENLFDTSFAYSYISWLPPVEIEQKVYNKDFMNDLMKIVDGMESIEILSLGALTDVALLINELEKKDELDKIETIFHLGGNLNKWGGIFSVDRSHYAAYNNYLDPDASKRVLKKLGKKVYWITAEASESIQFAYTELRDLIANNPTPESLWIYNLIRARVTEGTDVPENQIPDSLLIWDIIAVVLFLNRDLMTGIKKKCMQSVTDSSVCVKESKCLTSIKYCYNNELAEMYEDKECGYKTNMVYGINIKRVKEIFYKLLVQEENGALCNLMKPLGCYKFQEVTSINDL